MTDKLTHRDICDIIPHRYENELIDTMTRDTSGEMPRGRGKLTVSPHDPLNRDIFLEQDSDNRLYYSPLLFIEFSALAAITLMEEKVREGRTAVFSSIRNVTINSQVPAGKTLYTDIELSSISAGFHRFKGNVHTEDEAVCTLQIMAYAVDFSANTGRNSDNTKKISMKDTAPIEEINKKTFPYKADEMVFADNIIDINKEKKEITTGYTYPESHPFAKGHFPGNPIMMGITQIMMFTDAAYLIREKIDDTKEDINIRGTITKEDGTVICQTRPISIHTSPSKRPPMIRSIKNVSFRQMAAPGERLICTAQYT